MRVIYFFGFTLIEVLIALFILSFILLGFEGVILVSTRETYKDYYFLVASQQMITMIERLHALGDVDAITDHVNIWNTQNKQLLPQGIGMVSGSYPTYTVTIHWGKKPFKCDANYFEQLNCLTEHVTV